MQLFSKQLRSDNIKLSKTLFFILHLAIPTLGVLVFITYQSITIYPPEKFTGNYYQMLSIVYPLLAAWLCSVVTEQEIDAGGGFFLLSVPSRAKALLSKLVFLLGFGLLACMLATLGYSAVAVVVIPNFAFPLSLTFRMTLVIWGCAIFEYLLHTFLSLRFSPNVSFAFAALEILLAALMLTGLGERIWVFVPSAWGVRMIGLLSQYWVQGVAEMPGLRLGTAVAVVESLLMLRYLFLWFSRWEGRKNEE